MRLVVKGQVVTMNDAFDVIKRGAVCIADERIEFVLKHGEPIPAAYAGARVIDTRGTIFPGLIELHNHLSYNMVPLWTVPKKYTAREDWQGDADYKRRVSLPPHVLGAQSEFLPAMTRYVEAKCLVAGVTTSQGIGLSKVGALPTYYHGTVRNVESPRIPGLPSAATHIPDAASWTEFEPKLKKAKCMLLHLAEGTDDKTHRHFESLKNANGEWAVSDALAGIHCVGLRTRADFDVLGHARASMVWSPLSNFLLYGDTTKIDLAKAAGCTLALGSDWSPSGSKNLLFELKVAKITSAEKNFGLSDRDLVAMVTRNPAKILKWDSLFGSIAPGKIADLTVIAGAGDDPYGALIKATETDIRLVIIGGALKYGTSSLMGAVTNGETVKVGAKTFVASFDRDPKFEFVSLAEATETLTKGLKHVPELHNGAHPHALNVRVAPASGWHLADDDQEAPPLDLNPARRAATAMAMKATTPLPPVPIDLDPLTIADDAKFIPAIAAAGNPPQAIKNGIATYY